MRLAAGDCRGDEPATSTTTYCRRAIVPSTDLGLSFFNPTVVRIPTAFTVAHAVLQI